MAVISNFLAFFRFLFEKFSLLDPDPGGKMNADPYGSGSTALGLTMMKFDQVKEAVNNWHCEEFVSRREQNKIKYTTPKIIRIPA